MTVSSKRSEHVAWFSLVLSVLFFGIAFFMGRWSGFAAVYAAGWLTLSSSLIWFVLAIQFHQRALSEQEKLDMSQLAKTEQSSTIFQAKGEQAGLFAVARKRLQILEKWFLPIFAAAIATCQIGLGLYLLRTNHAWAGVEQKQPLLCAVAMMTVAFVSFLISRYATGMSAQPQWRPLRAGGSSLLAVALLCFALAIALAFAHFNWPQGVVAIAYIIAVLLIALGVETALNVVLDIYRPRLKDRYSRAAFDSRLLGVINEPGGIFRSVAGAIDYQFGFQVSQTWFYKLLEKAILPLTLFGIITLYLLSCIIVVGPDEEAIIERFGNPRDRAGQVRLIKPGLSFKWPWPFDIVYRYPTKQVRDLYIGFVPKTDPKTGLPISEPLLWGKVHYEEEYDVLVASQHTSEKPGEGAVPVSLVKANVPVQYRVKDLCAFLYNHSEPEKLLEAICYNELARFMVGATIEVDDEGEGGLNESLLGAGRARAKQVLTRRIQEAADARGLGIELVFLGLQGVHPPTEVAPDYQRVIGAVQKKQALMLNAHADRNKSLSNLVGSVEDAEALYELAIRYQQAESANDSQRETIGRELEAAFARARGDIFSNLRQSQTYAFERVTLAEATGRRFSSQLKAYRAAPDIYAHEQRLLALEEGLEKTRKYLIFADPNDTQVFIVDLKEKYTPDLYDLGVLEETGGK